jgi:MoaA/NifB/PqqE/SkfB family radical SAM enzyme
MVREEIRMSRKERAILNADNLSKIDAFVHAKGVDALGGLRPSLITLDLTWNCNLNCHDCIDSTARDGSTVVLKSQGGNPLEPSRRRCTGELLEYTAAERILAYAAEPANGVRGIQFMGGETLLYPWIDEILRSCANHRIPVEMVTNGTLIVKHVDALADAFSTPQSAIRISLNGWNSYPARVSCPGGTNQGALVRDQVVDGIKKLTAAFRSRGISPAPVFVSTVAFDSVLPDLRDIGREVADADAAYLVVIRPRNARNKQLLRVPSPSDQLSAICREITAQAKQTHPEFEAFISENLVVEPEPQPKTYQPCPCSLLKAVVGADGWLYMCSDHRGVVEARTVCLKDHGWDFAKAWQSHERVLKTTNFSPLRHCDELLCLRHEANVKLHALRCYVQWYEVSLLEVRARRGEPWVF